MNLKDYAREILEGESLNSKLLAIPKLENISEAKKQQNILVLLSLGGQEN